MKFITACENGWETWGSLISWADYGRKGHALTFRLGRNRWLSFNTSGKRGTLWFWESKKYWGSYFRSLSSANDRWALDLGYFYIMWEDM